MLWAGVALTGLHIYQGWQWLATLSPIVTAIILLKVSGVPMVRAQNRKKWGDDQEYLRYLKEVPLLIPLGQDFEVSSPDSATSSDG